MTKAYFYIKSLFQEAQTNDGTKWRVVLESLKVAGVEQLTTAFTTERDTSLNLPLSAFEYSNCSDNGTSIDACELAGLNDSWNPFILMFNGTYDNVVNTKNRGSFLASNSSNLYGIEGFGFGFDNLSVPINDIPSGGSTGASSNGAFFVNFNEAQDFEFTIKVKQTDNAGTTTLKEDQHVYSYTATSCSFVYNFEDIFNSGPVIAQSEYAFLSGGSAGWVDFSCGSSGGALGDDPIVTQSFCTIPTTPEIPQSIVSEDLEECCYQSPVLASTTSNDNFKNDINSFLFKRNFSSETITITLQKNGTTDIAIVNDDYGIYYDFGTFGDFPNYKGFRLQWQKVLLLQGTGIYRIKVESTFLTGSTTTYSIPFKLDEYTQDKANGTFRIQSIQNGFLRHLDFDYKNINWLDGLRVPGFFGNRQTEYEQEFVLYANRDSKQVRSELINTYVCQTMHVPDCITDLIIEYHNFANELFFTDYNLNNHKKTYIQKKVVFDSMDSIEYKDTTNFAPLQLNYKDFNQNFVKTNC